MSLFLKKNAIFAGKKTAGGNRENLKQGLGAAARPAAAAARGRRQAGGGRRQAGAAPEAKKWPRRPPVPSSWGPWGPKGPKSAPGASWGPWGPMGPMWGPWGPMWAPAALRDLREAHCTLVFSCRFTQFALVCKLGFESGTCCKLLLNQT